MLAAGASREAAAELGEKEPATTTTITIISAVNCVFPFPHFSHPLRSTSLHHLHGSEPNRGSFQQPTNDRSLTGSV